MKNKKIIKIKYIIYFIKNAFFYILLFFVNSIYSQEKQNKESYTIKNKQDKWGVINLKNKIIIPFKYQKIKKIQDTLFMVTKSKTGEFYISKTGIIDYKNKIIVPVQYQLLGYNSLGMVLSDGNLVGVLKYTNEVIIPFAYEQIQYDSIKNYYKVYNNKKIGIHDIHKLTIPVVYDNITDWDT